MEGAKESKSQEAPSSSSSKNNNKQKRKEEVDNGKLDKKLKMELEPEEQFAENEISINNLPPEMLMEILENLDTENLSACRLVNKKWNDIAIEIIQLRADVEIKIDCSEGGKGRNLSNFIKCCGPSKKFPFSRFLCQVDNSTFEKSDWMKIISDFGKNIFCLNLKINPISKDEDLVKLTKNLNNLLLNQLPSLQEFCLDLSDCKTPNSSTIQIFPSKNPTVQLPHLNVIVVIGITFSNYTGIVVDLLEAAVNLEQLWIGRLDSIDELYLLQSLGKLHCVQNMNIKLSMKFFSGQLNQIQDKSQAPLVLQLKELHLYMLEVCKDPSVWSTTSSFLSNLFETSKDTLRKLDMKALGFLEDLQLPRFSNLTELDVYDSRCSGVSYPIIPSGINLQNTFPLLNSLALHIPWTTAFPPEECVSIISTLETLQITSPGLNGDSIAQISSKCPNLKHLELSASDADNCIENFPEVGTAIWTHLKKLQSLVLSIEVGSSFNTFPAIDSCITGISKEDCQRLYDVNEAKKLLSKWDLQGRIPQSDLEAERKNVSILDLKDLKKLTINLFSNYKDDDDDDDETSQVLVTNELTFISEVYALKLMDHLTYKINRHVESP